MEIEKNIKELRTKYGYKQVEMAKKTGIPQNTISWIEKEKRIPNILQIIAIADMFDISIDNLVERTVKKNR